MTDRHQELLRQHELLREHLAWLEQEMARESTANPQPPVTMSAPPRAASATLVQAHATALPAEDADALLNTYSADERHNPESTKRGCLLALAITLGLVIVGVTTVYFLVYSDR